MNKAVIAVFPEVQAAERGINALKAYGYDPATLHELVREDPPRGTHVLGARVSPGAEVLKGLVVGAIIGAILGALASLALGVSVAWPSLGLDQPLVAAIVACTIVGAIAGLIEGALAASTLGSLRSRVLTRHRGDAIVSVWTDEAHARKTMDLLRDAGAWDVRRGASSLPEEFRTAETICPEPYGVAEVVEAPPTVDEGPVARRERSAA